MPHTNLFSFIKKFLIVTLLLCGVTILAQSPPDKIAFEKYGVAEGLPEEFARDVIQDEQGFIWITTQNGIVKYDGYNFKVFRGESSEQDGKLKLRGGTRLLKARDGKIWTGNNRGGVVSYDPKKDYFVNYLSSTIDPSHLPLEGGTEILFEDTNENIWFLNSSVVLDTLVLVKLDSKTDSFKAFPHVREWQKFNDIVLNFELLEAAKDSSIWQLLHPGNLNVLNAEKDSFESVIPAGTTIPGTSIKDTIRMIVPGTEDHFILSGDKGVYLWDPVLRSSIKSFTNVTDKDNSLPAFGIRYAFMDPQDRMWVFQDQGNFSIIDPENDEIEQFTYGEGDLKFNTGAKKTDQLSIIAQNNKGIWLATTTLSPYSQGEPMNYLFYDLATQRFKHYLENFNDDKNPLPKGRAFWQFRTIQDHSGLLWHATRPNIYKQSPKTRQIETIRHQTDEPGGIPSDTITSLFEDSKNRLWVGTSSGLSIKDGDEKIKELKISLPTKRADAGYIEIVYEDAAGAIWVGTYGKGLLRFNEKDMSLSEISLFPNSDQLDHSLDIETITEDASGNLWISVYRKGIYILEKGSYELMQKFETSNGEEHNMKSDWIAGIYLDSQGNIWLGDGGDNDFGLYKYLPEDKVFKHYGNDPADSLSLISNELRFIAEDDRGRLWIGTDGGLCLFDEENDLFYPSKDGFKIPSTISWAKAGNGKIWVSTYSGGGLALVGPNIEDVEFFGEEEGLLHNDIRGYKQQLLLDENGLLWLPTQRGLSVFDTESRTFMNYDERDGVQNFTSLTKSLKTRDGNIWIGGYHGINRIDPDMLFKKDSVPPKVVITAMSVNDTLYNAPDGDLFTKSVSYTEQVTLDHTQRDLSFNFVALHYLRPEDNLYSWKLENYDTDWTAPSKDRRASYTNLSPGEYTFRVKGSNADGIWNEEGASIHITIAPPWWQTWWAYGIYFLLLLFIGYRVHLYQKARTLKKAQEAAQKKELEQAKEIKKAYAELKATQTQLIQAEKMASLGELTAGIAHEIQNPLNFVNNFSEVNRELIEELKEEKAKTKKARDEKLEEELLTDIDQNLEKISHHGKRADSIVKGMLQHSRASSGEKEPTDINVLADEYLRLAYHGLRAKDKSFNATLESDFDKKIGKINVVPQDMGRVILNLITNAFHAVQERKKRGEKGYEPTVTVITKKRTTPSGAGVVEIKVKDNGNGIPKKIIQRIFEPFFTTKPTGHGTGLGLSLSYDIVKAHGGTLHCNSTVNTGTEFIIELPLK